MVLEGLKLHQFFMVWHEFFPANKHGCRKGGRNLKISAKKAVFIVSSGENQISPLLPLLVKLLEESTGAPVEKNLSDVHAQCTQICNIIPFFVKNSVVHPVADIQGVQGVQ